MTDEFAVPGRQQGKHLSVTESQPCGVISVCNIEGLRASRCRCSCNLSLDLPSRKPEVKLTVDAWPSLLRQSLSANVWLYEPYGHKASGEAHLPMDATLLCPGVINIADLVRQAHPTKALRIHLV